MIHRNCSVYEIKTEDVYEDLTGNKEMFYFNNYLTSKPKHHDNSNKLVIGKMKDKTGCVAIEQFAVLKPKMCSFLIDNNEHKKAKRVNKNVVATVGYKEYKYVLLNKKYIRHSMNIIQCKDRRMGTYEINKISMSCFDNKIYIRNNGYAGLVLRY